MTTSPGDRTCPTAAPFSPPRRPFSPPARAARLLGAGHDDPCRAAFLALLRRHRDGRRLKRAGRATEGDAIRLTGTVSTANNGGFIQARSEFAEGCPPGAGARAIRVRGNGERYFMHLRTRATRLPWQYYQAGFETGADWREVRLPFAAFERSGGLLAARDRSGASRSIGLVAFGRDHQADVSLAAIGTY
jgi:hypothetical protein